MTWIYLLALVISLGAMVALDARFRLLFWRAPRRATLVLAIGLAFFLVWDLVGIALGLFQHGDAAIDTGIMVAPELPIEELLFLAFLCYLTMVVVALIGGILDALRKRRP